MYTHTHTYIYIYINLHIYVYKHYHIPLSLLGQHTIHILTNMLKVSRETIDNWYKNNIL